jgi:hypothetical protein
MTSETDEAQIAEIKSDETKSGVSSNGSKPGNETPTSIVVSLVNSSRVGMTVDEINKELTNRGVKVTRKHLLTILYRQEKERKKLRKHGKKYFPKELNSQ